MARRSISSSIAFRRAACERITNEIGVYALCDLDGIPIYVGQSVDGIRARVRRHLTSARSDIIANRQVDVWEAAWVWAWPTARSEIVRLEATLFGHFDAKSKLMNGSVPTLTPDEALVRPPDQRIQVLADEDIAARRVASARLPRQVEHYSRLVDHFLTVKDSRQISLSLDAHFRRLTRYHAEFLAVSGPLPTESQDADGREND